MASGSTNPSIKYKGGYKYQLVELWKCILKGYSFSIKDRDKPSHFLEFGPAEDSAEDSPCCVMKNSEKNSENSIYRLTIHKGYAWDGVSYASDSPQAMRGSLVHDALYQLMREKILGPEESRAAADKVLRDFYKRDGMGNWAEIPYVIVRNWGADFAFPSERREVQEAPLQKLGSDDAEQEQPPAMIANPENDPRIKYTDRCNYQLVQEWKCILKGYSFSIKDKEKRDSDFLEFALAEKNTNDSAYFPMKNSENDLEDPTYYLTIKPGYAWDLCSNGLATSGGMRGSLVHDALYQLIREGSSNSPKKDRLLADKVLRDFCRRDGLLDPNKMYDSVRAGGQDHARPKKVYEAPPSIETEDLDDEDW